MLLAQKEGNLADAMDEQALTALGTDVVESYDKDKDSRKEWEAVAEEMLSLAAQDKANETKNVPWPNASNVNLPLLTIACLQFNARMYPAAIKGDEAILCKVIGQDNGVPRRGPNPKTGEIQPIPQIGPDGQPVIGPDGKMLPEWEVPPGAKSKRAKRVSEYLNTTIFYRMEAWEADTDALLTQLPAVGCAFRKVWYEKGRGAQSAMVPALRLVVNEKVRDLKSAPVVTEEIPDIYPQEIYARQREGRYLDVELGISEDEEVKTRLLLEQHRWIDLDEDGAKEPYIVTVDKESTKVLRVEANFSPRDIEWDEGQTRPIRIRPCQYYVKYRFFPHLQGKFYDMGLGHLMRLIGMAADTTLNQLIDAMTAKNAGGGFIASGLRLQGRATRQTVKFAPGEYKTVDVSGDDIRKALIDRTIPEVSPVAFQVLEFLLGFAREIGGFKDILTGNAPASTPVGTILAQIEQGLQVFNAVAKRFFRDAREEYSLLREKIARYGGEEAARDYANVLDDPEADFATDFADADMDIRPVSDPSAVTRMQKMARAEYLESKVDRIMALGGQEAAREVMRRSLEAADIEDIDKLLPPPKPAPPDPMVQSEVAKNLASAKKDEAMADKLNAEAAETAVEGQDKKYELEHKAISDGMQAGSM